MRTTPPDRPEIDHYTITTLHKRSRQLKAKGRVTDGSVKPFCSLEYEIFVVTYCTALSFSSGGGGGGLKKGGCPLRGTCKKKGFSYL